ncbi:PREDICTED: translocation protein SEC63 homolog [Rhagoletis zephyria]|uniref:translocation protein SEC63 homolog n=1 Tax=Rhagoletis zephyria TaxID=28612 RepID=UPI0008117B7B|nr:PREDICTED: translocation protein SEC63 homolog [Rhagoletis zephyria]
MAGTKFQYDESGTTFYYFVLTFMALVVIPVTYFYWPRKEKHEEVETTSKKKKCHCDACAMKQNYMKSKEPTQQVKQRFIKIGIIISWIFLLAFAYKVAHIQPDYVTFDPFEILGIDAGASKAEIKKAYHKLSLVYHPDKETGNEKRFMKISKAYAALTDEASRKNWEEYGNPDGPGAMSFGIALPSWIVEKENSMIVLMVYVLLLMIAMPIGVRIWWANSSKYGGGFKVLLDTSQLFYFYIHKTQTMNMHRVLKVISGAFEFNKEHNGEIVERPSDNKDIPKLIKEIPATPQVQLMPDQRDPPLCFPYSIKARSLLYAHLHRLPLPQTTLDVDKKYILAKCPYLIQEFVQCAAQLTLLAITRRIQRSPSLETIENSMKLNALLVQALPVNKNPLLQLPHVNEEMLRHFSNRKRNIRNMTQVAQLEDSERRNMLRQLSDEQYEDIVEFLGHLPLLEVDVRSEVLDDEDGGKITAGALVTVTVTLTRKDMSAVFNKSDSPAVDGSGGGNAAVDDDDEDEDANQVQNSNNKPAATKQTKAVWSKSSNAKSKKNKGKKNKPPPNRGRQNQNRPGQSAAPAPTISASSSTAVTKSSHSEHGDESNDEADAHGSGNESSEVDSEEEIEGAITENGGVGHLNAGDDDDENDWDDDIKPDVPKKDVFQVMSKISHSVHCPYFPEDKQEHWWIYITERKKTLSLITVPYFMTNLVEKEDVELKFTAPMKPGSYQYTVNVRCDSYVDMDYDKQIKIDVKEAPKEIETHPQWEISEDEEDQDQDDDSAVSDSDLVESDNDDDDSDEAEDDEEEK